MAGDGGSAAFGWAAALEMKTALISEAEALVPKGVGRSLVDLFSHLKQVGLP